MRDVALRGFLSSARSQDGGSAEADSSDFAGGEIAGAPRNAMSRTAASHYDRGG